MSNHCSNMVKPYWTAVKPLVTFIKGDSSLCNHAAQICPWDESLRWKADKLWAFWDESKSLQNAVRNWYSANYAPFRSHLLELQIRCNPEAHVSWSSFCCGVKDLFLYQLSASHVQTIHLTTYDTKAWSIKWKLSPNKVQCIDKSSFFWMLSYSQITSSLYSLCSRYCYVHYHMKHPIEALHPPSTSKHCIPRNINLVQTEIWDQTILAAWINEAGVWMCLKLHQTLIDRRWPWHGLRKPDCRPCARLKKPCPSQQNVINVIPALTSHCVFVCV